MCFYWRDNIKKGAKINILSGIISLFIIALSQNRKLEILCWSILQKERKNPNPPPPKMSKSCLLTDELYKSPATL